jgi:hypothetical protein
LRIRCSPSLAGHDDLDDAFAWKEECTISMNLTLQYDQVLFITTNSFIDPVSEFALALDGQKQSAVDATPHPLKSVTGSSRH